MLRSPGSRTSAGQIASDQDGERRLRFGEGSSLNVDSVLSIVGWSQKAIPRFWLWIRRRGRGTGEPQFRWRDLERTGFLRALMHCSKEGGKLWRRDYASSMHKVLEEASKDRPACSMCASIMEAWWRSSIKPTLEDAVERRSIDGIVRSVDLLAQYDAMIRCVFLESIRQAGNAQVTREWRAIYGDTIQRLSSEVGVLTSNGWPLQWHGLGRLTEG